MQVNVRRAGRRGLTSMARLLLLLAVLGLAGCRPPANPPLATPTAHPAATAPVASPIVSTATVSTGGPIILTWWSADFLGPGAGGDAGALMAEYLRAFETAQAGKVAVNPVVKARYGRGGLLDLMLSAQPVAPSVLPDLVALDTADLPAAAAAGLLQPLDGVLDPAVINGLYPFARQAARFGGRLVAVPFIADLEHLVYNRGRTQVPPIIWSDLFAGEVTYLFPVAGPQLLASSGPSQTVPPSFISQYLSAGGSLSPETHQMILEQGPLSRVLTFYSQAEAAKILPANMLDVTAPDECWTAYSEGAVAMANVSARRYLASRDALKNTGFAAPPGWNGPATPVASGWALAIVTSDPARQRAAAAWIDWLLTADRLGAWAQAAGWLPAAPKAWAGWGSNQYYEFLQSQLAVAIPAPAGITDQQAVASLQRALVAVLGDGADPEEVLRSIFTPAPK